MANIILYSQIGYRPLIFRPIACYTLARWLEEHGYTVQVIEFTHLFSAQELVKYSEMFIDSNTFLIGVSSTMWRNYDKVLNMMGRHEGTPENIKNALSELKLKFPKIKTMIGGQGLYNIPEDEYDFMIRDSFGENSVLKLADELSNKTFGTKLTRKQFIIDHQRFVFKDHDCILPGETLPVEWGRGCIFQCPFCRDPNIGKKPGTDEKPVSLMVDQFTELYEKFGTTAYYFLDETFNANSERLIDLEKVYNKLPFELEFISYNRGDLLDAKPWTQDILHSCGQRGTLMGIESFTPEAAKSVAKPWSGKRAKDFLLELKEKWPNTHIDCHFIAGLPGDTVETLVETSKWLEQSNLGFYWFLPLGMMRNEQFGTWEKNSEDYEITWPKPDDDGYWERGYWNWHKAYHIAATLNRKMKVFEKYTMWTLGPFNTAGVPMKQAVNKKVKDIIAISGDLYLKEEELFNMYKEKLAKQAGR